MSRILASAPRWSILNTKKVPAPALRLLGLGQLRCYAALQASPSPGRLSLRPRSSITQKVTAFNKKVSPLQTQARPISSIESTPLANMASDRDILPSTVKPSHYDISLYNLQYAPTWSFEGTVKIDVNITTSTKEIQLNAHQLKIKQAGVSSAGSTSKASSIDFIEARHRAILTFADDVPASKDAVLTLQFSGTMNNAMCGFYRSKYNPPVTPVASVPQDAGNHYMFSTQFESCDARRAFPCFDEPNLKATFDFKIEIPDDQTALSNMPVKTTKKSSKSGRQVVSFERSPKMSTYLLAWAFGDFEYVEAHTKRSYNGRQLPVRVYTTRGLKEQGRFALENAHQVIDLFSDVFRIDYPLPKSDLLAVHEFSHGAMENWGLVTYRTTAVLFDEANSDQAYKNRVAYVVAHELAHQWFGNLVTMDWWSELWLNEGFATWVGWYAVNHLHPSWNVWSQWVGEGMQTAFKLDSIRNSHPIEVPVRDALEVDQIFDSISYLKGSSCIRMLAAYLGTDNFLLGVSNYLKAHAYGNATTVDLWKALSEASGKDVPTFMDPWIRSIGFPVVTAAEEPGQIGVGQQRFLSTGDVKPNEDKTTWWIPLGLRNAANTKEADISLALTTKQQTLRDIDDSFYKLNADNTAFYRTNYPPARLEKLGTQKNLLSDQDKIGIIGDAAALAVSGHGKTPSLLSFLESCPDETNKLVWGQIVSSLGDVRSVFAANEKISAGLKSFVVKLTSPAAEKLGWEFPAGEDYLTAQTRSLLIGVAGLAGHKGIVQEAQRRFDLYVSGKDRKAIHPNLRSAVFRICMAHGTPTTYESLKTEYLQTPSSSIDNKEICLQAMGRVPTPESAREYFTFLMTHVPTQDIHSGAMSLAANGATRHALWECIKEDWEGVYQRLSGNMVVLDRFLRVSLNKFADAGVEEDMRKFFEGRDTRGFERSLGVVLDTVRGSGQYYEREETLLAEWLGARGYV